MTTGRIAKASITIAAPRHKVWRALVNPLAIKRYMFGTTVRSDFRAGSTISWKGEWEGKSFEERGTILTLHPNETLTYTQMSGRQGLWGKPASVHTVTMTLSPAGNQTHVELTQDNNADDDALAHSEEKWVMMLMGLKRFVESQPDASSY